MPSGMSAAELRDTIKVHLDAQTFAQVSKSNLVYQGGVVLSSGKYHLKFIARENESGKISTFEQDFVVLPAQPSKMTMSSVLNSRANLWPRKNRPRFPTSRRELAPKFNPTTPLDVEGQKNPVRASHAFSIRGSELYTYFSRLTIPIRGATSPKISIRHLRFAPA